MNNGYVCVIYAAQNCWDYFKGKNNSFIIPAVRYCCPAWTLAFPGFNPANVNKKVAALYILWLFDVFATKGIDVA